MSKGYLALSWNTRRNDFSGECIFQTSCVCLCDLLFDVCVFTIAWFRMWLTIRFTFIFSTWFCSLGRLANDFDNSRDSCVPLTTCSLRTKLFGTDSENGSENGLEFRTFFLLKWSIFSKFRTFKYDIRERSEKHSEIFPIVSEYGLEFVKKKMLHFHKRKVLDSEPFLWIFFWSFSQQICRQGRMFRSFFVCLYYQITACLVFHCWNDAMAR